MLSKPLKYSHHPRHVSSANSILVDIDSESALRHDTEKFVTRCFQVEYSATVQYFLERHILSFDKGMLRSVVGYKIAGSLPLYLEQYLSAPAEHVIAQCTQSNTPITRSSLVEVGNLASTSPGSFRRLVLSLCRYFSEMGASWVVFTSTPQLVNTFRKLGMELILLGEANPKNIKNGANHWGNYYQKKPTVMAGNIEYGLHQLTNNAVLRKLLAKAPKPLKEVY